MCGLLRAGKETVLTSLRLVMSIFETCPPRVPVVKPNTTVRRQVESQGNAPVWSVESTLPCLEVEERDEVVARHVDRGLLFIGQHDQTVAGPLPSPAIVLVTATCLGSMAIAWT